MELGRRVKGLEDDPQLRERLKEIESRLDKGETAHSNSNSKVLALEGRVERAEAHSNQLISNLRALEVKVEKGLSEILNPNSKLNTKLTDIEARVG